jgi:hypothetical protein
MSENTVENAVVDCEVSNALILCLLNKETKELGQVWNRGLEVMIPLSFEASVRHLIKGRMMDVRERERERERESTMIRN